MRVFIAKYGIYIASLCIVVAALLYVTFGKNSGPTTGTTALAFYVDENNLSDESVHPASELPPLNNKDNKPTLVQAIKRSDQGGKNPYIAYLQKYTPETRDQLLKLTDPSDPRRAELMATGLLVRLPQPGKEWVSATSAAGQDIITPKPGLNGNLPVPVHPAR